MKIRCKGRLVSNTEDTFGRTIVANGVSLERFKLNSLVLCWHDSKQIPVGQVTKLIYTADSCIDIEFEIETDLMANEMVAAVKMGYFKCLSSGLNILDNGWEYNERTGKERLTRTELSEVSMCSIGRNKNCQFVVVEDAADTATKSEVTL